MQFIAAAYMAPRVKAEKGPFRDRAGTIPE
jgi:hypothetical protein